MRRKMITGVCRICGREKPLSFEHIPPRAAFNNRPVIRISLEQAIELGPDVKPKGPVKQKGMGDYVLCEECNNNSGSWYASRFVDWCYRGMEIIISSKGNPSLAYTYNIFPLSVLKQIIVMFLAVNNPRFSKVNPGLVAFVSSKENNQLPLKYRVYSYYNIIGMHRNIGLSAQVSLTTGKRIIMSEVSFPPFGYLLTIDSDKPDYRLSDISGFGIYTYDDKTEIQMRMAVLPTHLLYPGDYRSREEILGAKEYDKTHLA
jgi:hypothetical protein